jgi:hypothetical protein
MVKRRQFIGFVTALSGSYVLTACGGGGGSSGGADSATSTNASTGSTTAGSGTTTTTTTTSATQTGATSGETTATSGTTGDTSGTTTDTSTNGGTSDTSSDTATASADGAAIPPAASITDSQGAVWTVVSGIVYRNGVAAGNAYNVQLLLWYGGVIYAENTVGHFYGWSGSTWLQCADPRLGGTSADGATVPPASQIIDKIGSIWTLSNGVVLRNGSAVGTTSNAALLLWYGGKLWYQSTGGQFYVCTDVGDWLPCSDPRIAVAATSGTFHGINGHYDYRYSASQLVRIMQNMGCSTYRIGCTDDSTQISAVTAIAQAFQAAGLTLFVVMDINMYGSNGVLLASESAAYTRGYNCGAAVATALAPYGVLMYECGNELTRDSAIIIDGTNAGTKAQDFNNTNWPVMRGMMRGMMDGVKSIQPSAKCGINFCVADVGAADALWDGKQPDGTSGYQPLRWDMTTWHNYEIYGDIFDIGTDGSGPGFDLPTYCKARYGVPFLITEWNTGPEKSTTYRANYITTQYTNYYQARKTKNIQSAMLYELDSGNDTYGIMIDGATVNQTYNAFVGFIASHPDN